MDEERDTFTYQGVGFQGISQQITALSRQLEKVRQDLCEIDAIAAVPDWWQIRPEGRRPNMTLMFGESINGKIGMADRPINVPHWKGNKEQSKTFNLTFTCGNWMGIARLADNSAIIVNCAHSDEAKRVLNLLLQWVADPMRQGTVIRVVERQGGHVIPSKVLSLKYGKYFIKGLGETKPNWVINYAKLRQP
jgi:hypothetical protein